MKMCNLLQMIGNFLRYGELIFCNPSFTPIQSFQDLRRQHWRAKLDGKTAMKAKLNKKMMAAELDRGESLVRVQCQPLSLTLDLVTALFLS